MRCITPHAQLKLETGYLTQSLLELLEKKKIITTQHVYPGDVVTNSLEFESSKLALT